MDATNVVDKAGDLWVSIQKLLAVYGLKVLAAVAILIIGRIVAKVIKKVIASLMEKSKQDPTLVSFVSNLSYAAMIAFVIIAALGQLGIQTASFVAILGAAGLAIGLALQGSLANFASGVLMIIFKPFKVGDYVEGNGIAGTVSEVDIFTTHLTTPDNKIIIVPNAQITSSNIINYSALGTRRIDLTAGIGYGDDIDKAKAVLKKIVDSDSRILKDPECTIAVAELADSSVNFVVRPWVKVADYWDVKFAVTEAIKKQFDAEGISIPFPQSDVHLYKHDA
jgi:small conductance mechanosensitive channel